MSTSNKVALITGANKGLGLEIARQLGQQGVTVLVGARDAGRGEEATEKLRGEGIDARFLSIDVTKQESIDAAAQSIANDFGRLDVLVNNAGIAPEVTPPSEATLEGIRLAFEINFFGVFAVTHTLLPLLRKSEAARIVNMSSDLGSLALSGDPSGPYYAVNGFAYGSSKTALNALTVSLAKELRETPIKVNSVTPGYTATDLNNFQGPRTVEEGAREPVRLALLSEDGPSGGFFDESGADGLVIARFSLNL